MRARMFRRPWLLAALAAGLLVTQSLLAQPNDEEGKLLKIERGTNEAFLRHDKKWVSDYIAKTFVYTTTDGNIVGKKDFVDQIDANFTSLVSKDMAVHLYGNAAVVTGADEFTMESGGKKTSGAGRWTDTFIKLDGRWQLVATQETLIRQKASNR